MVIARSLQVLANFCGAAADAMAHTLMRTAHSAFIKETEDFSCQIVSREGLAFANPRHFGAPWYSGIDYGPLLAHFDNYRAGDICITNDPEAGHVSTHTPDIHIWKPVFHNGEIACFVVGHIHNTDVGGAVPASLSRSLTEIAQEGLRIPPVKLLEAGVENTFVAELIRSNVRMPEQNLGDLAAQIASVNVGERKMGEIIQRFGISTFLDGVKAILDHAEAQARAVIANVPDGDYFFADFADEDSPGGLPARIAITVRVQGNTLELDYTGSDPQLASSLNMPTGGRERHPLVMVGLTYVLATLSPGIWLNAGTLRPARAVLPEGSVVNSAPGAAIGMRSLTCAMTQIVTIGAFAQAVPDKIPAAAPGGNAILNIKAATKYGRPVMASIGPVGGGGGATPFDDGSDGAGGTTGFLRNTPLEITEAEVPIQFRRYGLEADSGGPGRWRGGLSAVMEFQVFSPGTVVTARNRNRSVMASWGLRGAGQPKVSTFELNPGTERAENLGNTDLVKCGPGDIIRVVGPGAGGIGHPFERLTEDVAADVRRGYVSVEAAKCIYGVVLKKGAVDDAETARLRTSLSVNKGLYSFSAERLAFEAVWSRERYELLTEFLAKQPVGWRAFLKQAVFQAVTDRGSTENLETGMQAIFEDLQQKHHL
ncbi:hydantoinase B/oxoprolinase family protein [Roseibium sp. HPY-6]|uniref:hydantoinase B/oxoprolinase family protein n=1 Tax=Roseibium sp. HPY-6 TaxID=3229852 RepID=UPI00338E49B0